MILYDRDVVAHDKNFFLLFITIDIEIPVKLEP